MTRTTLDAAAATWEAIDSLTPWAQNPRNNDDAVEQVAESIRRFGFAAPIVARAADRSVIAGHTRLKAARQLGLDLVPVRFVDLDEDEARALALADNKLNEIAAWDEAGLSEVLRELEQTGLDLAGLGWQSDELDALLSQIDPEPAESADSENPYTKKIRAPTYTPKGDQPAIGDLYDGSKAAALIEEIDAAALPPEVAAFLRAAASRHTVFHFKRIAEYYCHSSAEVQSLFERSALVIIDFDAAVENGFVHLTERLAEIAGHDANGVGDEG